MARKLFLILFTGFLVSVHAQIPKQALTMDTQVFPLEKVRVSMNSDVLLAGELLQYKGYALDDSNKKSKLSKTLYVSLRNETDSVVFSHKLPLENGTAAGDYFLPASLKTGVYTLVAYTNFAKNKPLEACFQKNIYVINTFVKVPNFEKKGDTVRLSFLEQSPEKYFDNSAIEPFQIASNKTTYHFREQVSLNITQKDPSVSGNFSLSVRKINPVEVADGLPSRATALPSEIFYLPEMRGEILSGVVISEKEGTPVPNQEVSLTIPGKDFIFKIAKTNASGRFFFSISEGYEASKSLVQLSGGEGADRKIVMDPKNLALEPAVPSFLKLDPQLENWLKSRSVQLQIENAYFEVKKDSVLDAPKSPRFFDNLGTVYGLDDYTRFATVRETFIEIVSLAAIRGAGDAITFSVNNPYDPNGIAKFNNIPPLVLMDGIEVRNNSEVINYNAREIEKIRVINKPYRYGPKIYSGIIAITTKKGNFVPNRSENIQQIDLPPLEQKKIPFAVEYGPNSKWSRIPDYRVQLLWQPEIRLTGNTYETIFFTSDVSGIFEMVLEGFSDEGKFISVKNYFNVVEN
jgi:hypothetical protein